VSHGPSASGGALVAASPHGAHQREPHVPVFTGETLVALETIMSRYPTKQAALLPALWMLQDARGWVSEGGIDEVSQILELSPAYVKGVVSFYTMYHQHPVGRHFIQVCTTTPCNVCGAEDVVRSMLDHTGCGDLGLTSADGKYTVVEVECLGACGFATPIMINNEFVESVTPESVPRILSELT